MKLGPVAVAVVAAAALLSGCGAQHSEASQGAAGAETKVDGPGVTEYLGVMRSTDFVVVDLPSENASEQRKASESLKLDRILLLAGNSVCDFAAAKGVQYGRIVEEIVDNSTVVGNAKGFVAQERAADGSVLNPTSYDDKRVVITKRMDYQMAETIVRASVPNLCPTFAAILPGYPPAT